MKRAAHFAPVELIDRPEFKPGFVYGLELPVCIVKVQLAANIWTVLAQVEGLIHSYIGEVDTSSFSGEDTFTRSAAKIAAWCLEVQNRCGLIIHRNFKIRDLVPLKGNGVRMAVVLPVRFVEPSVAALSLVIKLINTLSKGKAQDNETASFIAEQRGRIAKFRENGQNVPDLLNAAIAKGISFRRIVGQAHRFGMGAAQCVLESTFTEKTSVIGTKLSQNKLNAARILMESGFPGGHPVQVRSGIEAIEAARRIGYPVVVKPVDSDGGNGVSADLRNIEDLEKAFEIALSVSTNVMVDRHVEGIGHRLTVLFGKVVKVTAKQPWGVHGDGVSTISDLVREQFAKREIANAPISKRQPPSNLDDEAMSMLRQQGLAPDSIPGKGGFVKLRRRNNANVGGSTLKLGLEQVHDDNLELALRVANLFMLDAAGIDLIIPDISRSWLEQDCLVCDVNSKPQLGAATAAEFLYSVIPGTGRVPVTLVLFQGRHSPSDDPRLQSLLKKLNIDGLSSIDGIWINGRQTGRASPNGFVAGTTMLSHRDVFNAAVVMSIDDVTAFGLPSDRFQRLVIMEANSRHTGNSTLRIHAADGSSCDAIEHEIFQSGLVPTYRDASLLIERIGPHFSPEL